MFQPNLSHGGSGGLEDGEDDDDDEEPEPTGLVGSIAFYRLKHN